MSNKIAEDMASTYDKLKQSDVPLAGSKRQSSGAAWYKSFLSVWADDGSRVPFQAAMEHIKPEVEAALGPGAMDKFLDGLVAALNSASEEAKAAPSLMTSVFHGLREDPGKWAKDPAGLLNEAVELSHADAAERRERLEWLEHNIQLHRESAADTTVFERGDDGRVVRAVRYPGKSH